MKVLSVTEELDSKTLGIVDTGYKIPPRCDKCGAYIIVQDMDDSLFFRCTCGNMGTVHEVEVDSSLIEKVVLSRRVRK